MDGSAKRLAELRQAVARADVVAMRWGRWVLGWTLMLLPGLAALAAGWRPSVAVIVVGLAGEAILVAGALWAGSRQVRLDRRCQMAEWMR